ncbi:MAG: hypothetical protein U0797_00970 [Gemmataceae bacterium]
MRLSGDEAVVEVPDGNMYSVGGVVESLLKQPGNFRDRLLGLAQGRTVHFRVRYAGIPIDSLLGPLHVALGELNSLVSGRSVEPAKGIYEGVEYDVFLSDNSPVPEPTPGFRPDTTPQPAESLNPLEDDRWGSFIAQLKQSPPETQDDVAYELAFGERTVPVTFIPRLEGALDHPSPRVLALVLTTISRSLTKGPAVALNAPDRVRQLTEHPDSRVEAAAWALVAAAGRHALPTPGPTLVAVSALTRMCEVVQGFDLEADYPLVREKLVDLFREYRAEVLAPLLEPAFLKRLRSFPTDTREGKQALCKWANSTLGDLGLAVAAPDDGAASSLVAGTGGNPTKGRIEYVVLMEDGTKRKVLRTDLPEDVSLVPARLDRKPGRREADQIDTSG